MKTYTISGLTAGNHTIIVKATGETDSASTAVTASASTSPTTYITLAPIPFSAVISFDSVECPYSLAEAQPSAIGLVSTFTMATPPCYVRSVAFSGGLAPTTVLYEPLRCELPTGTNMKITVVVDCTQIDSTALTTAIGVSAEQSVLNLTNNSTTTVTYNFETDSGISLGAISAGPGITYNFPSSLFNYKVSYGKLKILQQ